jgi:predicted transcriptional regulator
MYRISMIEKRWFYIAVAGMFAQSAILAHALHYAESSIYLAVLSLAMFGMFVRESCTARREKGAAS